MLEILIQDIQGILSTPRLLVATVIYTFGCHYLVRPNLQRLNILVNMLLWIGYSVSVLDLATALTDATTALVDTVAFLVTAIKEKRKGV